MTRIFLSLGSNIRPNENILSCLTMLRQALHVKKVSSIYETVPIGGKAPQDNFWNLIVEIDTQDSRQDLSEKLHLIEEKLGRTRQMGNKFAPRIIDIDVLPQPDYQKLGYVMIPLAEIAPAGIDPETGKTFKVLAESLAQEGTVLKKINLPGPCL